MAVRSGQLVIDSSTGPKKLSDILGVAESWTHVFIIGVSLGGTAGSYRIGDANIATNGGGIGMGTGQSREFVFQSGDNPANELYFYNSSASPQVRIEALAY